MLRRPATHVHDAKWARTIATALHLRALYHLASAAQASAPF